MDKRWLKSYPHDIPAEIDYSQYGSLVDLLEEAFKQYAQRDAYVCMGKRMRYAELDSYSRQIGAWLQSKGLQKGACVAIMLPNVLQYPIVMAGILRAGYTVVNVNPLYTPRELEHQLRDSGAEAIFILENFATTLQKVLDKVPMRHIVVASMGDMLGMLKGSIVNFVVRRVKKLVPEYVLPTAVSFKSVLEQSQDLRLKHIDLTHDDIAFLQYTGGTTGLSKGAMLAHRNILANVLQNQAWCTPSFSQHHHGQQKVFVCALPLYHIFALTVCGLVGMRLGAFNILIPNPRDIPGFVKELKHYKVNLFPAVNTLYNALLNNKDFASLDFSELLICSGGGMAVQKAVADRWLEVTGCPITEGYGLSETSPVVCSNLMSTKEFSGMIGIPYPSTEIDILDDDGKPVPIGQPGEIAIRGPQVMVGYWNRPDETEKAMTPDGFFKSGDIGIMDERGYIKIVDRKKDMILVSGFNVYPNEIEGVVASHPGVFECACVGVPDEQTGEAVKLFVVRKDPALTAEMLIDFCKTQLTAYKRPKFIEFRLELPKTNVGKILRRELRDEKPQT
jgi:long-chain acyl-CoA synthetase